MKEVDIKYDQIQGMEDEKFRRLTGVKRKTFSAMVEILTEVRCLIPERNGVYYEDTKVGREELWDKYSQMI